MSHQTGIHATEELKATFAKCKSKRDIRCIRLSIDKEKLICDDIKPMSASTDWKQDWCQYLVGGFMPKQRPCYVLFRLGGKDSENIVVTNPSTNAALTTSQSAVKMKPSIVSKLTGPPKLASLLSNSLSNNNSKSTSEVDKTNTKYDSYSNEASKDLWLFVSWTPDSSPVRDKMIYASTKSTVKQEFGGGSIFADYFVSSIEDLSLESVKKWIDRKQHYRDGHVDVNELSLGEQELHQVKAEEAALCADLLATSFNKEKNKSMPSLEIPIADSALAAFNEFKQGKLAYIQLSIDPKTETILLEKSIAASDFNLNSKSISSLTPNDHARYHLVCYSHQHNKKQTKATLFIYSIPSSGCPVKERMLYSSVKNSLIAMIQEESKIGITFDRRIETDDPAELTGKFLYEEIYPSDIVNSPAQAIIKPKGPAKQTNSASRRKVM